MFRRMSMKFKLTTLVVVMVGIGTFSFGKFAFSGIIDTMDKAIGLGVLTATETLAESVDPVWLDTFDTANVDDAEFKKLVAKFTSLVRRGHIKRIEIIRPIDELTVEHVINVPVDGTRDYYRPGTRETLTEWSWYFQKEAGYHVVDLNEPGTYVAGWVPVRLGEKEVGLLSVYIDGGDFQSALATINIAISILLLALVTLSGTITYKFAATFEKTAVTDGLMGIYNHKYFKQRLEQEVARSRRYGHMTSLVLLDIDFFKRVNDTYGHTTGDIVLKNLAKWINESCRTTDVVCRYGGEEIVVILTHTGIAGAQEYAERLRIKISQQVNKDPGEGAEFRVTVSVGVAQYEKGLDMIGLIKRADAALYHSKHTGRNRVTIYTDEIPVDVGKDKQETQNTDR